MRIRELQGILSNINPNLDIAWCLNLNGEDILKEYDGVKSVALDRDKVWLNLGKVEQEYAKGHYIYECDPLGIVKFIKLMDDLEKVKSDPVAIERIIKAKKALMAAKDIVETVQEELKNV